MSGIYIPDMEMPKNCYECHVRNQGFSGNGMKCGKTGSVLSWYDGNRKRMDDCPLVPAADVRPVVLCRDCEYYQADCGWCGLLDIGMNVNGFCSRGEKREES